MFNKLTTSPGLLVADVLTRRFCQDNGCFYAQASGRMTSAKAMESISTRTATITSVNGAIIFATVKASTSTSHPVCSMLVNGVTASDLEMEK
jgi:hypothetical protein